MANEKAKQASSGLKKLTEAQKEAIKALYEAGDKRFTEVEKLVNKTVLYQITGDNKYAPKANRNERADSLNSILFK